MQPEGQTILVIEDEGDIRELLAFNLERDGYHVIEAGDGLEGLALARSKHPDLIVLDIMLPGMNGFTVCRELEKSSETVNIPIIILTARGETVDRILGLELGADDYLLKPFNVRELLLRIKAILRRQHHTQENDVRTHRGVRIDNAAHKVSVHGEYVDLTATEFRLLDDLLAHPGRVRTREDLLASVWGYQFDGYARTVDTHVRRLRSKLGEAASIVETVRGVGYRCKE